MCGSYIHTTSGWLTEFPTGHEKLNNVSRLTLA